MISSYTNIDLIRIALTLEGCLTPYLTLKSNEYQSYEFNFVSTVVKNCVIFWGEGGGYQKITLDHRGEEVGQDGPKKDLFDNSI